MGILTPYMEDKAGFRGLGVAQAFGNPQARFEGGTAELTLASYACVQGQVLGRKRTFTNGRGCCFLYTMESMRGLSSFYQLCFLKKF